RPAIGNFLTISFGTKRCGQVEFTRKRLQKTQPSLGPGRLRRWARRPKKSAPKDTRRRSRRLGYSSGRVGKASSRAGSGGTHHIRAAEPHWFATACLLEQRSCRTGKPISVGRVGPCKRISSRSGAIANGLGPPRR